MKHVATRLADDRKVERIRPRTKRFSVPEGLVPGLALRISPKGRKSWSLHYRVSGGGGLDDKGRPRRGEQRRATLGTFPSLGLVAARKKARDILELADAGRDPVLEAQRAVIEYREAAAQTVRAVALDHLERVRKPTIRTTTYKSALSGNCDGPPSASAAH